MRPIHFILALLVGVSFVILAGCDKDNIGPEIEISGGTIWVIDQPSNTVLIFNSDGVLINTVGGFIKPIDLDINQSNGDTWVIDFYGDQLKRFDKYGNYLFGTDPPIDTDGDGIPDIFYLRQPTSICIEQETSDVWVADYQQNKVLRINNDGEETGRITGFVFPRAVNVYDNSGKLWVSDEGTQMVYRFSTNFTGEITVDAAELAVGGFDRPRNILAEASGGCWVLDIGIGNLSRIDNSGVISTMISGFEEPAYITLGVDETSVYVSDNDLGIICEVDINVSGTVHIKDVGRVFLSDLSSPTGIVTDALAGVLYVCAMGEDRVGKYDLETGEEILCCESIDGPLVVDFYRENEE